MSAIESHLYLPTTAVALQLASVLACRVEDLFSLVPTENFIEGTLVGHLPQAETTDRPIRVKVSTVGKRTIVRPVTDLGEQLSFAVPADGYISNTHSKLPGTTVRVTLSRDRDAIAQEISVAGCDPAIFLIGEHMRRLKDRTSVVGWTMGSMAALQTLQRGDVHVAGMHLFDPMTGESNLPFLKRALKGSGYDLDFGPLQTARYDLVVPKPYVQSHPTLAHLFETIVSRPFRNEIEALGGYDTSETGKVRALRVA